MIPMCFYRNRLKHSTLISSLIYQKMFSQTTIHQFVLGSSSIWTCPISNTYLFLFSFRQTYLKKSKKYSKFGTSKSMSYQGHKLARKRKRSQTYRIFGWRFSPKEVFFSLNCVMHVFHINFEPYPHNFTSTYLLFPLVCMRQEISNRPFTRYKLIYAT